MDYEREDIVFFLPVLEQKMIRNICFKNFETYFLMPIPKHIFIKKCEYISERVYIPTSYSCNILYNFNCKLKFCQLCISP